MSTSPRTVAVIMAGGSGTRFWPLSRKTRPKQLLALLTERSLLVETIARVTPAAVAASDVLIVTGKALAGPIAALATGAEIVVEPVARNTAPCIALAAARVAARDPKAVMAVLPADQTIEDVAAFRRVFAVASALAAEGRIATVGIRPDHPETGYGYIRRGPQIQDRAGVFEVAAFVEKPDAVTAARYLEAGDYDWNAGMFFMRADVLLAAVDRHLPGLSKGIALYRAALGTPGEAEALDRCFELAEAISIDYGIMERETPNIVVLPADIGWSDVGSWRTLLEFRDGDEPNFVRGDVLVRDTEGCVVVSSGPQVSVIGLRGLAVVATPDAVMVAPLERSQDVGQIPKALEALGRKELL